MTLIRENLKLVFTLNIMAFVNQTALIYFITQKGDALRTSMIENENRLDYYSSSYVYEIFSEDDIHNLFELMSYVHQFYKFISITEWLASLLNGQLICYHGFKSN